MRLPADNAGRARPDSGVEVWMGDDSFEEVRKGVAVAPAHETPRPPARTGGHSFSELQAFSKIEAASRVARNLSESSLLLDPAGGLHRHPPRVGLVTIWLFEASARRGRVEPEGPEQRLVEEAHRVGHVEGRAGAVRGS